MAGAVRAAQPLAQPADPHQGREARRIDLGGGRHKRQIDPRRPQQIEVGRLGPRIGAEILVGGELLRIDEDGGDDPVALGPRRADQRHMPGVQGAHRRHQPDALARPAPPGELAPQIGDRPRYLQPRRPNPRNPVTR